MESQDQPQDSQDNDAMEDNNNEVSSSPSSASTVTSGQQPTTSRVLSPDQEGLPPVPVASSSPVIKQNQVPVLVANPNQQVHLTTKETGKGDNETSQGLSQDPAPKLDIIEEWVRRKVYSRSLKSTTEAKAPSEAAPQLLEGGGSNNEAIVGPSQPEDTPVASSSTVMSKVLHQEEQQQAPRKECPEDEEVMSPIYRSANAVKRRLQYEEENKAKAAAAAVEDTPETAKDTEVAQEQEEQEAEMPIEADDAVGEEAKSKTKPKKKRVSSTKRSGLVLSVSRINRRLKAGRYARRIGFTAGVYTAAVLEYLVAEVLELAGNCARYFKKHRIFPRCIQLTLLHDKELYQLTRGAIVPQGGVKPFIHPALTGYTGTANNAPHALDEGDKDILQSNFG